MTEVQPASESFAERVAREVLELPQAECPVTHCYARQLEIPAGVLIVGKKHKQACVNIMLSGKMRLLREDGSVSDVEAPAVFETPAGSQKIAFVFEPVRFLTIHPDAFEPADIDKVESLLFEESPALQEKLAEFRKAVEIEFDRA